MREMKLIYSSRPFGYDELTLVGILASARRNNERDGITGALICHDDLFVQLLEGRRDVVTAAFSRISHDDRRVDVVNLWSGDIDTRLFPGWSMATILGAVGCGRWAAKVQVIAPPIELAIRLARSRPSRSMSPASTSTLRASV